MPKFMHITLIAFGLLLAGIVICFIYGLISSWLSWYGIELPGNKTTISTVHEAVANKNLAELERLIKEGVDVDITDNRGQAPILLAAVTDQFQMVDRLIDAGANIWAFETLGYNVGIYTSTSHVSSSSVEGIARERVIEKLKARGFPWPPPFPDKTLEMVNRNDWPPVSNSSE